jgi:hypothetical protein
MLRTIDVEALSRLSITAIFFDAFLIRDRT